MVLYGHDPIDYVLSKNIHRRHLTPEQKRELIAKLVKATPGNSDRQIAGQAKASPSTVGRVRKELEHTGDVSKLDTRADAKGRKQRAHKPTTKKRRDVDDYLAEKTARIAKSPAAQEPEPQQTDIENCIADATGKPTNRTAAEGAIRKMRDQIEGAVATAIGVLPMQPIIDTIFDHAALLAERNGNVELFAKRVRQRIDAMERQLGQAQEKPAMPLLSDSVAEGISSC